MNGQLQGRNAVVTGGTRGLGRTLALTLARAGANVLTCYRSDDDAAEQVAAELKALGGDHHVVRCDLGQPEEVGTLVSECRTRLGSVEVLVNNAGTISHSPAAAMDLDEWRRVLDVNLTSVFLLTQGLLPLMGEGTSVVNIGAAVAMRGLPLRAHYTAAKAGLVGLSRSLCKELGSSGIRVNVVAPGVINTPAAANLPAEVREGYERLAALGRLGEPEEIAEVVLFLASDAARYITGETITIDGGI